MKRGDLIKTDKAIEPVGGKMSPAALLNRFDDWRRLETQAAMLREKKLEEFRAALVALVEN